MSQAVLTQSRQVRKRLRVPLHSVHERVRSLQMMASAVLGGLDAVVVAGPAKQGWSWSPSSRVIQADSHDLQLRPIEFCHGLVLHELGHAAITRYPEIVPKSWLQIRPLALLLNLVEDGRLERWVTQTLPGSGEWIANVNREFFTHTDHTAPPKTLSGKFLQGLAILQYFGEVVTEDPVVQEALVAVAPSLARILAALPLRAQGEPCSVTDHAYAHHTASQVWLHRDISTPPSSFEKSVRMTQMDMWGEVHANLWPKLQAFLQQDRLAGRLQDRWILKLDKSMSRRGGQGEVARPLESAAPKEGTASTPPNLFPGTGEVWEQLRNNQAETIDFLSGELLRLFGRWERKGLTKGHVSGVRPDLRAVVRAQADPRAWDRVWVRQTIPHRADPCFVLLLDRSGSMADNHKARHTLEGAVAVAEACRVAGVPLEVWSFADTCTPLLLHHEPLGSQERKRIEGYVGACESATQLAEALEVMSQRLSELPWRNRILLVLSDGEVEAQVSVRYYLKELSHCGVVCVGLGVGPETRKLAGLFPDSPCGIDPSAIGAEMSRLLARVAATIK